MKIYNRGEEFNIVISTKNTLFGAKSSDFTISYAPTNDLSNLTMVDGGLKEGIKQIEIARKAIITKDAAIGISFVDIALGHTILTGDVVEYAKDNFAYVILATKDKLYFKIKLRAEVKKDFEIKEVGNSGIYNTKTFKIKSIGKYLLVISAPKYNLLTTTVLKINEVDEIELPTLTLPNINMPSTKLLNIKLPQIDIPQIDIPNIEIGD